MKTSLFDFNLPDALIAERPTSPRDAARMLVVDRMMQESLVRELPKFLRRGDVIVFNDTKVIPARLYAMRGDAKIEILLHKQTKHGWECFAKPAKKLKIGDELHFAEDFSAVVESKHLDGQVTLVFGADKTALRRKLEQYGQMPLPPYIPRDADAADREHYQTIYAKYDGSVAAPTAGLHFTESLLKSLDIAGVRRAHVTLHVGGGTFVPVKAEDTDQHVMHAEWAEINATNTRIINEARQAGGRVIAVGSTSLRTLEAAADELGHVHPYGSETDLFITPGYRFKVADMLLTNFHLPRSTLFMLTCAFCGVDKMKAAYAYAMSRHYRFYSYGDACLLYRQ